nr:uncharacterized protein LOC131134615 isoform X2 [Doryrhamphus excisus]
MTLNGGVKALLRWVRTIHSCHRDVNIEALQDGELLLHVVFKLKKEPNPPSFTTIEERFKVIAEFVEQHCRFSPSKGTSLSWDNIRNVSNLSVETAKKKLKASCFPRPLTSKNKNINSGPSSAQLHPALSPADRRQSMMFTIDNTPKKNNSYLKKGLSKLRSSTRKSPGKTSKRPPADVLAKENMPAAVGRGGRCGSFKSPQVHSQETRNSPQTVRR